MFILTLYYLCPSLTNSTATAAPTTHTIFMNWESSWWVHLQEHLHCPKHAESALNADFLYKGQLPPVCISSPATPVPSLSWTGQGRGWGMESIISRGLPTSHLRVPSHQLPASFQGHRRGKPMRTGTQHAEKKVHPASRSPHTPSPRSLGTTKKPLPWKTCDVRISYH